MNEIMAYLHTAEKGNTRKQLTVMSLILFWLFIVAVYNIIAFSAESDSIFLFVMLGLLVFSLVSCVFFAVSAAQRFMSAVDPKKSRAWKRLVESRYADTFMLNIDDELNDASTITYHDDSFRFLRFWLTPKWIILISSSGSIIHRRSELTRTQMAVARPSSSGMVSRTGGIYLRLFFSDGVKFDVGIGRDNYTKIMEILKQELPNVVDENTISKS